MEISLVDDRSNSKVLSSFDIFSEFAGLPFEKMETTNHATAVLNLSKLPSDNINKEDNSSEVNQCGGSDNNLQWVLIALILVVPIFLVLIACCCCSCCAFCKICSCLKPAEFSNKNIKPTQVYFESKPCIGSQESVDSNANDSTCPLFRSLTHPKPIR